jgi:hypothetical protein
MTRVRRDLDDDDLLDAPTAKDLRAERAEESARLERLDAVQLEAEARRKAETDAWRREANVDDVLETYVAAGVQPPPLEEGRLLCSLPLLLSVGWTVREIPGGEKVLVRPPEPAPAERRGGYRITTPEPNK